MSNESNWETYADKGDRDYSALTIGEARDALRKLIDLPDDYKIKSTYYVVWGISVNHESKIVDFGNSE